MEGGSDASMPGMDMSGMSKPGADTRPAPVHELAAAADPSPSDTYTCRMHPQIAVKAPGSCPICGMTLVKKPTSKPQEHPR